jgi:hypothetical protein
VKDERRGHYRIKVERGKIKTNKEKKEEKRGKKEGNTTTKSVDLIISKLMKGCEVSGRLQEILFSQTIATRSFPL